jgi:hypothetical protein
MTRRNRSLFLERGHAYIYLAYGSSYMLNVSSEMPGIGAGVLIRALEPLEGIPIMRLNRGIERLRDLARDQEGSPRCCGLIVGSMGSIFAEKALYGSDAVTTTPAKSGRALGSAFRGMRTASCDFIFGTVRSSAAQDRSRNKRLPEHTEYGAKGSTTSPGQRRNRPKNSRSNCAIVADCPSLLLNRPRRLAGDIVGHPINPPRTSFTIRPLSGDGTGNADRQARVGDRVAAILC